MGWCVSSLSSQTAFVFVFVFVFSRLAVVQLIFAPHEPQKGVPDEGVPQLPQNVPVAPPLGGAGAEASSADLGEATEGADPPFPASAWAESFTERRLTLKQ